MSVFFSKAKVAAQVHILLPRPWFSSSSYSTFSTSFAFLKTTAPTNCFFGSLQFSHKLASILAFATLLLSIIDSPLPTSAIKMHWLLFWFQGCYICCSPFTYSRCYQTRKAQRKALFSFSVASRSRKMKWISKCHSWCKVKRILPTTMKWSNSISILS